MSKIKVKASNTLAKVLNEAFKNKGYDISLTKMSEYNYSMMVDYNIFNHDEDFDYKTNLFKVIMINYPDDYYACSKFLTTKDLLRILKNSDKTFDGFIKSVWNEIEI